MLLAAGANVAAFFRAWESIGWAYGTSFVRHNAEAQLAREGKAVFRKAKQ